MCEFTCDFYFLELWRLRPNPKQSAVMVPKIDVGSGTAGFGISPVVGRVWVPSSTAPVSVLGSSPNASNAVGAI